MTFSFRDRQANHDGIGNKISIFYGVDDSLVQVREIKSGGGFLSHEAPVAHFGLGQEQTVGKIRIQWSDGEVSNINETFRAGQHYVIERAAAPGYPVRHASRRPDESD